jgi:hypothetical protein
MSEETDSLGVLSHRIHPCTSICIECMNAANIGSRAIFGIFAKRRA